MKTTKTIFLTFLFLSMGLYAHAQGVLGSGNDLIKTWESYERYETNDGSIDRVTLYEAGLFVGFVTGVSMAGQLTGLYAIPDGVTYIQTYKVVGKFLENHPEKLHLSSGVLVINALMEAFPLFKKD